MCSPNTAIASAWTKKIAGVFCSKASRYGIVP